jgi:hypothetical protein
MKSILENRPELAYEVNQAAEVVIFGKKVGRNVMVVI